MQIRKIRYSSISGETTLDYTIVMTIVCMMQKHYNDVRYVNRYIIISSWHYYYPHAEVFSSLCSQFEIKADTLGK